MDLRPNNMILPPHDAQALGELLDVTSGQFDTIEARTPTTHGLQLRLSDSAWHSADWITAAPALPLNIESFMPFTTGDPVTVHAFHQISRTLRSEITLTFNENNDEQFAIMSHAFNPETGELEHTLRNHIENDRFAAHLSDEDMISTLDALFQHSEAYVRNKRTIPTADLVRCAIQGMDFGKSTEQATKVAPIELLHASAGDKATFAIKALAKNRRHPGGEPSKTSLILERPFLLRPDGHTTTNVQVRTIDLTRDQFGDITEASQRFNIILGGSETASGQFLSSQTLGVTKADYRPYLPPDSIPNAADARLFLGLITQPLTREDIMAQSYPDGTT